MTVWIKFAGWFQCRLATDPDPYDEPRGVSGYVHAVAGEPDLDRVIRLQPTGTVPRSRSPKIGVHVVGVYGDPRHPKDHPLVGGTVELLDEPKFEGRNHVLADDGVEALVPCHLRIRQGGFVVQRRYDDQMRWPSIMDEDLEKVRGLQATGVNVSPGEIGEATGIFDLGAVWHKRRVELEADLAQSANEVERAALQERIKGISELRNARFFAARMLFSVALAGTAVIEDPMAYLPGSPARAPEMAWPLEFWCGGWDSDALCGYMVGYLGIPIEDKDARLRLLGSDIAAMMADPMKRRR